MRAILLIVMTCISAFGVTHAATDTNGGEVRVPLEIYRQLVEQIDEGSDAVWYRPRSGEQQG